MKAGQIRKKLFENIEWPRHMRGADEATLITKWMLLLPDIVLCNGGAMPQERKHQVPSEVNLSAILHAIKVVPRYNITSNEVVLDLPFEVDGDETWIFGMVCGAIRDELMAVANIVYPVTTIEKVLTRFALANRFNPIEEWLNSLDPWENEEGSYIDKLVGTVVLNESYPHPEMLRVYIEKWLIQAVQAAMGWRDPKQMGHVLVFMGDQGVGKGMWLSSLVPNKRWFNDALSLHVGGRNSPSQEADSIRKANGAWISSMDELENVFDRATQGGIKAFLTTIESTIRLPYDRAMTKVPRIGVFAGTVNGYKFLRDNTGSRRFWPVAVERLNWQHGIPLDRLWAEAYALWDEGMDYFLEGEQILKHTSHCMEYRETPAIEDDFMECLGDEEATAGMYPMTVKKMIQHINMSLYPEEERGRYKAEKQEKSIVLATLRRLYGENTSIRVGKRVFTKHWLCPLRVQPKSDIDTEVKKVMDTRDTMGHR